MVRKSVEQKVLLGPAIEQTGIDPGIVYMGVACVKTVDREMPKNVNMRTRNFHHDAGYYRRKHKLHKLTGALELELETERVEAGIIDGEALRQQDLRNFGRKHKAYMTNRMTNLRRVTAMQHRQTIDKYGNNIIAKKGISDVFFGDGCDSSKRFRKYIKPPQVKFHQSIDRHPRARLHFINEYNTTRLYCFCKEPNKVGRNQYTCCERCKVPMHRDANAAEKILQKGLKNAKRVKRGQPLSRGAIIAEAKFGPRRVPGQRRVHRAAAIPVAPAVAVP